MINFFDNFATLTDAPNGVAKLRELILQLAVRGKLVPQDPEDEPASPLLADIVEKRRLQAKREGLTLRDPRLIDASEVLFQIPDSWKWVRLESIALLLMGQSPPGSTYNKVGEGVPLINGPVEFGPQPFSETIIKQYTSSPTKTCRKGDLLICVRGATTGRTNIAGSDACIGRGVAAIRAYIFPGYINLFIHASRERIYNKGSGSTFPSVSQDKLRDLLVPLPPLPEQHRIVAKVDKLMALCDELEARQRERREVRVRLHASALNRLLTARKPKEFSVHWRRIRDHFDLLHDTPETIPQLRQAILQLAVQGKLVPQDPKDEPAAKLMQRIDARRRELVADGKLPREPRMKEAQSPDIELPSGWEWQAFGRITFCRDGERIPVARAEREAVKKTYDYYGASGVIDKVESYLFDKPLLLIGEDGANLVNRSTPIAFIAEGKYWVNNHAHVLDGIDRTLLEYLRICINSINLEPYLTGMAQPKMNQTKMNSIPVPLPPLPEQRRIVAKVDKLMALCDALEARLTQGQALSQQLLESTVHDLLARHA